MILKKLVCSALVVSALGFFSVASANNIVILTDVTTFTVDGSDPAEDIISYGGSSATYLTGQSDYVNWRHHFVFDPKPEEIIEANLTLYFHDDGDVTQNKTEHAKIKLEGGNWQVLFQGNNVEDSWVSSVSIAKVADGCFGVSLRNNASKEGYYIDKSELSIKYSVPEPSIFSLLGLSLLGVGFIRRKSKR
jgi:hypothetical protein